MPGFVRSKKDEQKWKRAKDAVSSSKKKSVDAFTDKDWALVNKIYHTMKKAKNYILNSGQEGAAAAVILDELSKARKRALYQDSDYMDEYNQDEESEIPEGFHVIDEEGEKDDEDRWLEENDSKRESDDDPYADYDDIDESDAKSAAEDFGVELPGHGVSLFDDDESYSEKDPGIGEEKTQNKKTRISSFPQPAPEELKQYRSYTIPWVRRARDAARLKADPSKNPVLAHQGSTIEARNKFFADKRRAYEEMVSSAEYQSADPITRMEMDEKFENEWRQKNPSHLMEAMKAHSEAHQKSKAYKDIYNQKKQEAIQSVLSGAQSLPSSMSMEEAAQHVGGVKGDDDSGTQASFLSDPVSSFASKNQDFIQEYSKIYNQKAKKPTSLSEMATFDEHSKRDLSRLLGPAPASDPKFEKFFSTYYPLISISANRAIKTLGLDPKKSDVDMSLLHEAGMHALFQAINDYDPRYNTSFSSYAANKIKGMQMTALKSQDQIPSEIRRAHKKYVNEKRMQNVLSKLPDPEKASKLISQIKAQKEQNQAIEAPESHSSTSELKAPTPKSTEERPKMPAVEAKPAGAAMPKQEFKQPTVSQVRPQSVDTNMPSSSTDTDIKPSADKPSVIRRPGGASAMNVKIKKPNIGG